MSLLTLLHCLQMISIAAGAWLACKCRGGVKLRRSGTCADYESVNDCEQFLVREPFSCDAVQINGRTWFFDDTWEIKEGEALVVSKVRMLYTCSQSLLT